jgi:microsomal epoxide hydrolase
MRAFVHAMFRRPQPEAYLDALTETCLRTPPDAARALLSYPVPRTYWRDALYATSKPILYVVRPGLAAQARNLALHRPDAETAVFADAGHALFVDDASRFDALLSDFARTRVRPRCCRCSWCRWSRSAPKSHLLVISPSRPGRNTATGSSPS